MPQLISATYHLSVRTAEFIADNGDHLLRSGGSPAWRFNNPGNMRPSGRRLITTNIGIATMAGGGKFLIFPDYQTGRAELKRLLRDSPYASRTLSQAIHVYAPSSDANNPDQYTAMVENQSGVSRDTVLGTLTDGQLEGVINGIERVEGYQSNADTRSETWVKATHIVVSDGARPVSGQTIVVTQGGQQRALQTSATGSLPAIPHKSGAIDIMVADATQQLKQVAQIAQQDASGSLLLVKNLFVAQATTAPHVPPQGATRTPRKGFIYRIRSGDSLSVIAARFKISVDKIKSDNGLHSDEIFAGKALHIYEAAPSREHSHRAVVATPAVSTNSSSQTQLSRVNSTPTVMSRVSTQGASTALPDQSPASVPSTPIAGSSRQDSESVRESAVVNPSNAGTVGNLPLSTSQSTIFARSQEGQARPLAMLLPDQPEAPWMSIALREAERWKGADESVITQTMDYHELVDEKSMFKTLVGSKNAWCAAFVNWVMAQDGRKMIKNRADRHRARGFTRDPNFVKIEQPIFGAISVLSNLGHVFFIYGKDSKTGALVVLGGNQGGHGSFGGTIDFSEFKPKQIYGYYVPASYLPYAKKEIERGAELKEMSAGEMNRLHKIKDPRGNGTR